jgi:hypothetical protein
VTGNANALGFQDSFGASDGKFTINDSGNVTLSGTALGSATAVTVTGNADAATDLTAVALNAVTAGNGDISIGGSGDVVARADLRASSASSGIAGVTAQTVDGAANADATLSATAISDTAGLAISMGHTGSITGLATLGTLTGSAISDAYDVTASALGGTDNATANADGDVTGIAGVTGSTTLTAGPAGGNVYGSALGGLSVSASAIGGDANSSIGGTGNSDIIGISNSNITAGLSGVNTVSGLAVGSFNATATSISGAADGSSEVTATGILGTSAATDSIKLSGNVSAIANLTNTVLATSVTGNATATAVSNAVGMQGYDVTIIGNGSITGTANSMAKTVGSTTNGIATGTSTL